MGIVAMRLTHTVYRRSGDLNLYLRGRHGAYVGTRRSWWKDTHSHVCRTGVASAGAVAAAIDTGERWRDYGRNRWNAKSSYLQLLIDSLERLR